jgi:putative ABC transport system ATP-binding protein
MIDLKNISRFYNCGDSEVRALQNISMKIEPATLTSIMGRSGSGKTTLLNIIGCLDRQTAGDYILDNQNVSNLKFNELAKIRNATFGFVLQQFALIPYFDVYSNVEIPLNYSSEKLTKREKRDRVRATLNSLGILNKEKRKPSELSGGQLQRVAIARALVNDPKVILADEPTGQLDSETGREVMDLFHTIHAEGRTVIMVTHDEAFAKNFDRVLYIKDGQLKTKEETYV